ncbi:MAG: hypothetical protein AB1752_07060 [Candidatus Zixiibacteriota bacterium]
MVKSTGSEEVALFYSEQFRKGAYSSPLPDRDAVNWPETTNDKELWTGCYALVWQAHEAQELFDHVQQFGLEPVPEAELPQVPPPTNSESDQGLLNEFHLSVWRKREKLKLRLNRIVLGDEYGRRQFPFHSDYGPVNLMRLDFSHVGCDLLRSREWLADDLWTFRDTWLVPLEWADTRILFDVEKMEDDLRGFLKTSVAGENQPIGLVGTPEQLDPKSETIPEPVENRFTRTGPTWSITFKGKTVGAANSKGAFFVSILVKSAGQWIEAQSLRSLANPGIAAGHSEGKALELDPDARTDRPLEDDDLILPEGARRRLAEKLRTLNASFDAAVKGERFAEAERIDEERQALIDHQGAATGLHGRRRALLPDQKRAVDSVRSSVNRFLKQIEEQHLDLFKHLKSSIDIGASCRYHPDQPTSWSD